MLPVISHVLFSYYFCPFPISLILLGFDPQDEIEMTRPSLCFSYISLAHAHSVPPSQPQTVGGEF